MSIHWHKIIFFGTFSSFFIDENYNIHIRQAQQTPALPTTRFSRSVFKRFVTSVDQPFASSTLSTDHTRWSSQPLIKYRLTSTLVHTWSLLRCHRHLWSLLRTMLKYGTAVGSAPFCGVNQFPVSLKWGTRCDDHTLSWSVAADLYTR